MAQKEAQREQREFEQTRHDADIKRERELLLRKEKKKKKP